jgi:hypothetical protein
MRPRRPGQRRKADKMARKLKVPVPRKLKRNPMARELGSAKYKARIVAKVGVYRRRAKHPKPPADEGQ